MESRKQILHIHTKHMPIAEDVDIQHFAQMVLITIITLLIIDY